MRESEMATIDSTSVSLCLSISAIAECSAHVPIPQAKSRQMPV